MKQHIHVLYKCDFNFQIISESVHGEDLHVCVTGCYCTSGKGGEFGEHGEKGPYGLPGVRGRKGEFGQINIKSTIHMQ